MAVNDSQALLFIYEHLIRPHLGEPGLDEARLDAFCDILPQVGHFHPSQAVKEIFYRQIDFFGELRFDWRFVVFFLVLDRYVDDHLSNTIWINYEVHILHALIFLPYQTSNDTGPVAYKRILSLLVSF